MKSRLNIWIKKAVCAAAIFSCLGMAANVYAASSYQVGNTLTQLINEWSTCKQVTNNTGKSVFVPTNSSGEWSAFRSFAQSLGISLGECYSYSWQTGGWGSCSVSCGTGTQSRSVWCQRNDGTSVDDSFCGGGKPGTSQSCDMGACCAPNTGQSCASGSNSCGDVNYGTIQCNGSCSVGTPSDPPGYGAPCSSAPNNCGEVNYGSITCGGWCSVSAPADEPYEESCYEYCANSDYVCDFSGYNCSYECVDYEQNCYQISGC